jgi:hypothetical protein
VWVSGWIQIVGRTEARRCPYCHDLLRDEATLPCRRCDVQLHTDCWDELDVCPCAGCPGRPVRQARALSPRQARLRAERRARRARIEELQRTREATELEAEARRPRSDYGARFSLYGRLLVSALAHLLGFVVSLGGLILLLGNFRAAAEALSMGMIFLVLLAFVTLYLSAKWLVRVPRVFFALGRMLDEERPRPARLTVTREEDDRPGYFANLHVGGRAYRFRLTELLRPGWLDARHTNARVWLYGQQHSWDPPWVIEFDDGWLALVYPEDEDLERIRP